MTRWQVIGSIHGGQQYLGEVLDLAGKGKVKPIIETFRSARPPRLRPASSGKMRFRGVFTP